MTNMYECSICLSLNHASRIHCSVCGTIPRQYSIFGIAGKFVYSQDAPHFIPTVVAIGAVHACKHHAARVNLRTVSADYYAN